MFNMYKNSKPITTEMTYSWHIQNKSASPEMYTHYYYDAATEFLKVSADFKPPTTYRWNAT